MAIKIIKEKCIGCGRCAELCPETFRLGEDGKSMVINEQNRDCAERAADHCPVEAIVVE
ncbi:ferredoxin [Candidatus Falkowbacteria bacterium CG_4_10_14_0_2_um_filter_48_10]|uniref:Ferredoxin n=1 Tax=Candidatus Falkowbacteria bacterium CG23_combo_of_CG06-09_8_20_14_all_49_15 TaxID=1974572 RepID=A0A2G9ZKR7_9BACT|nr:MAG: ferredoxin [Candidatus Falkowbacteria bacterium CG23_combo_of_CG06-09_8_20_14_all_49_15]PJA09002.1 MAG: ferredoxin [Candidatus Falkowbacteria bacterium CG_4_10_14_0_2_um_filter_48_10]